MDPTPMLTFRFAEWHNFHYFGVIKCWRHKWVLWDRIERFLFVFLQEHTEGYLVRIWDTETVRAGCGRRKTQAASSPTSGRNAGSWWSDRISTTTKPPRYDPVLFIFLRLCLHVPSTSPFSWAAPLMIFFDRHFDKHNESKTHVMLFCPHCLKLWRWIWRTQWQWHCV